MANFCVSCWRPVRHLLLTVFLPVLVACSQVEPPQQLSPQQLEALAAQVLTPTNTLGAGEALDLPGVGDIYLAFYRGGRREAQAWGRGDSTSLALSDALLQVRAGHPGLVFDHAELSLAYGFRPLDPVALGDDLSAAHRGVRGLEVNHGDRAVRFAPSMMVADNLSFEKALSRAAVQLGLSGEALVTQSRLVTFESLQVVVARDAKPAAYQLFRGNRPLTMANVTENRVVAFSEGMQDWMLRNLDASGRMTYLYYTSSGRESTGNNMIRQWMASLCLTRMAIVRGDPALLDASARNIRYNLERFYSVEDGLGVIEYRGKVKLGAVALAALAILEHPQRDSFQTEYEALVRMTDHLWQEDGSFQTFYRPASRSADANLHNFYPGEALLLWATILKHGEDPQRAERFMQSFQHYRQWHLFNRKPSFIPWHTQAYFMRWQQTGDEQLRDWIFEMNDWLLQMQGNSRLAYDDTLGRFYDPAPERSHYGPPHASSTGVYLEGLIDAYRLALFAGDHMRAQAYRESIRLGLRSGMQLQLKNDGTLWYSPDPVRVSGGLRTTVYNNVVRVDNVQHMLMAVLKMLNFTVGEEGEYALANPAYQRLLQP